MIVKWIVRVGFALLVAGRVGAFESDVRISAIDVDGSLLRLHVATPPLFTNRLDILSCSNLVGGRWSLLATGLSAGETNYLSWSDNVADHSSPVFYRVGNHDQDSDSDGLPDAWEAMIYHTDPLDPDSDDDGISDGDELNRGTDPRDPSSRSRVIFADSDYGSDLYDGMASIPSNGHGPKRSVGAANGLAHSDDTIQIKGRTPFLEPMLSLGSRTVLVRPMGLIVVRP